MLKSGDYLMMTKHLKIAALLLFLLLPLLCFGLYQNSKTFYTMARGNYFFQNTRLKANLETIILDFGNDYKITITRREGLWRIKEADDYFASGTLLNELFKFITNTVIYRADTADDDLLTDSLKNSFHFTSFNSEGAILDDAIIAPQKKNGLMYAKFNNLPYLYQLNSEFKLSPVTMDWIQMPIVSIDYNAIKRIDTDAFNVYRQFASGELMMVSSKEPAPLHLRRLTNNLHNLTAQKIQHAANFDISSLKKVRHYDITLVNGLMYGLSFYKEGGDYWMTIKLDKAAISTTEAEQILKERRILYDGWFFKIDKNKGQIISDFIL